MTLPDAVAVLDIGKSNLKLAVLDRASRAMLALTTMKNRVQPGPPYPHFDVDAIWSFFISGLAEASGVARISVIAVTTHGAAAALVGADDLVLPVLDYEHAGPDAIAEDYRRARGPFSEILSPDLPGGLNIGRQIFWQARLFPDEFADARSLLGYPQYWVFRLTGARVAEPTAFGAHTDLWNARDGDWSSLAKREGWAALVPPRIAPWASAGRVHPEIAAAARLPEDCRVVAGIHDSNASLLPHILHREPPFAVLSTGTWMITFAAGGSLDRLDPARGGLAYVDAFGRPVPSAMSMTGREYEILTGGVHADPKKPEIARVLSEGIMALPGFTPGSGPFGHRQGSWSHDPATLSPGERTVVASLYAALVAEVSLNLAGADGPVLVEGPFARNPLFLAALAARLPRPVIGRPDATGTTEGAALLAEGPDGGRSAPADPPAAAPLEDFGGYADAWHKAAVSG